MHPIVAAFVEGKQRLIDVLENTPVPRDPPVEAMLTLRKALFDPGCSKADMTSAVTAAAQAASRPMDRDLCLLLLGLWSACSMRLDRIDETVSITKRMRALVRDTTHPVLKADVFFREAHIADYYGDSSQYLKAFDRQLGTFPHGSMRWRMTLLDKTFALAVYGTEEEVDQSVAEAVLAPGEDVSRCGPGLGADMLRANLTFARIVQCIETVRLEDAGRMIAAEMEAMRGARTGMVNNAGLLDFYLQFHRLLKALVEFPGATGSAGEEKLPEWAEPLQLLLQRRTEEALQASRRLIARADDPLRVFKAPLGNVMLPSFNLVRAELACGHGEAARRLIEARRNLGTEHYMDDLFLARADLLTGFRDVAAKRFAKVMAACRRYRAEGRLDFELRMAGELSPADVVQLLQHRHEPGTSATYQPVTQITPQGVRRLVGKSRSMASLRQLVTHFAQMDVPVLVSGETGVGKELVARALHEAGPRAKEPFLAINCGAIAEPLLESELFGHEKGAFTGAERAHRGLFEEAGGGSILLDEIGEIPPRLQVALLRVLETGEVRPVGGSKSRSLRCRILAATNADLERAVADGRFRQDLYYRLKRLTLHAPALRERPEDILPLAEHFLAEGRLDSRPPTVSAELAQALTAYRWPGNVRELRNAMERMRLLNSDKLDYGLEDLDVREIAARPAAPTVGPVDGGVGAEPEASPAPAPAPAGEDPDSAILAASRSPMRRLDRLRALFAKHGKLTRVEVMALLKISQVTATRDLYALCREGLVEKVAPSGSPRTHYFRLRS